MKKEIIKFKNGSTISFRPITYKDYMISMPKQKRKPILPPDTSTDVSG